MYREGKFELKNNVEGKNNKIRNKLNKEKTRNIGIVNGNGKKKKEEVLKKMLKNVDDEVKREEIIHMLLEQKVSKIIKEEENDKKNFSSKLSDFIGSKKIIYLMGTFFFIWIVINVFLFVTKKFNPFSFIILNIILSCVMLIFCSLIIFNQNKMKKLDEKKSENDYKVNLKNEIIIEDLHYKLDELIEKQDEITKRVLELETKKKGVPVKEKRKYKFIDISEYDKGKNCK